MLLPSGEMSRPPMAERTWISSGADAVRLAGSPPATNLTHTSAVPRASERKATHFPSGEIAGPNSWAGVVVSRRVRENDGAWRRRGAGRTSQAATAAAAAARVRPHGSAFQDVPSRPTRRAGGVG